MAGKIRSREFLDTYLQMVRTSRLLAPNLKELTLKVFTGNEHKGNAVAR